MKEDVPVIAILHFFITDYLRFHQNEVDCRKEAELCTVETWQQLSRK